jgi:hypothetical protein
MNLSGEAMFETQRRQQTAALQTAEADGARLICRSKEPLGPIA